MSRTNLAALGSTYNAKAFIGAVPPRPRHEFLSLSFFGWETGRRAYRPVLRVAFPPLQLHHQITPRLLSIPEAAVYIGGTNWFVEELLRDGKLEAVKVGKGRRIDRKVLDAWIDAEEQLQKEKPPELGGFAKKYHSN